ncbi:MAG: hypothetical protein WBA47_09210 [Rhodanobacter sp.]
MPLSRIPIDELRSLCRHRIEALELWLRRLIHDKFSSAFGLDYFHYQVNGNYIFRTEVRKHAETRVQQDPRRYSRPLDALLLDHLVDILCKEDLFTGHFREALRKAFPEGRQEARTFLTRLVEIRNPLSHANPISSHQALRVFCYADDVIESIQEHYAAMGAGDEFNAPNFVTFRDSAGNSVPINKTREHLELTKTKFRVGDRVRFEVDTDGIGGDCTVHWVVANIGRGESGTGNSFTLELTPRHVNESFTVSASLISSKDWHRHGNFDAHLVVTYKVLPPP